MNKTRKIALAVLSVSAAWPGLIAQTTTPRPAPAAATDTSDEELVVLTPFEISTAKDTGYQATQTLAGTRIRTDLKDVGSAISVITKDFLVDVGATDSATLLQYTTNAEVAGTRGTYAGLGNGTTIDETTSLRTPGGAQRVRGLASADNTRDFFVTDIPWDSYNVDRIDIQRGPNSILFGLGSPAGIVNASTHNADFRNFGDVSARTGSYGSMRTSIDLNQQLVPGVLAIRVDSMISDEKYEQKPAYQNDKRLYGALRFDPKLFGPSFHTSIKAKFEHGDISANRPRIAPPRDSITPWFRNPDPDKSFLFGGMGKTAIYSAYNTAKDPSQGIYIGASPTSVSPWLASDSIANQQQPIWFMDGTTNQLYNIYAGYVNTGARTNVPGAAAGGSGVSLSGQRYSSEFFGLRTFSDYATQAGLKDAQYGQYRDMTLTDKSVFDFYHNLIDGPTKSEFEKWNAYNLDLTETAFDDRIGVELSLDRQKYKSGGQAYLSNPTINIDILQNFQDLNANPNFGRAYVASTTGGSGNTSQSDRKYLRGSLFGELRTKDFIKNDFLAKLLGKHRFNGVYGDESYRVENRSYQMYANSQAWDGFWNQNTGLTNGFQNRAPVGIIYLGQSLANRSSASGAYVPGITAPIALQDGNVYLFESTWKNNPVYVNDPWTTPAPSTTIFNSTALPAAQNSVFMQNSNPANYVGWNTNHTMNLVRDSNDSNPALTTQANITERQTKSLAGTWQGFMWNNAIVPTLGWRYDEVESKTVSALPIPAERLAYNLSQYGYIPANTTITDPNKISGYIPGYVLPDGPISTADAAGSRRNQTYSLIKNHSTSGGLVVHINELFPKDPLPIGITLAYNKSNNFQVTNGRYDIYGKALDNPTGNTKEYSVLLSTKDGKYSLRAIKYETALAKSTLNVNLSTLFGNPIVQGLKFRNVLLYKLTGYTPDTGPQVGSSPANVGARWLWAQSWVDASGRSKANFATATGPAGTHFETPAEASTHLDNTIKAWNDIQAHFDALGYFKFWGYTPTNAAALDTYSGYWGTTDYTATAYPANKAAPTLADTYSYSYPNGGPLGFTVTNDSVSKGYEYELTANPLPNWRISVNASQTTAVRNNVGDGQLADFISYMDTQMAGYAGDMRQFNGDYAAGNEIRQNWTNNRASYTLLKLQEGAAASELRKWRYNIVTNYSFIHGFLKGTGVGAAYRWQDKVVIGYPVIADPANAAVASFDLSKPFYGPAEDALDLWLSYERKLTDKLNWKIQFNVRNVMKKDGLIPISVEADGQTWASARIKPVQEWFLTNTFSF